MVQSAFFEAGSVLASLVCLLSQEKMAVSRQAEPRVEIFRASALWMGKKYARKFSKPLSCLGLAHFVAAILFLDSEPRPPWNLQEPPRSGLPLILVSEVLQWNSCDAIKSDLIFEFLASAPPESTSRASVKGGGFQRKNFQRTWNTGYFFIRNA